MAAIAMNSLDKVPPFSLEAERAVLGSMLIEKEALDQALELLEEQHFYSESHRKIFTAIRGLSLNDKVIDRVTLGEELRKTGLLPVIGGPEYITQMIDSVATAAHVEHYAGIVKERAVLRELIKAGTQIVSEGYSGQENVEELLDRAESLIYRVSDKKNKTGLSHISKMLTEVIGNLEDLYSRKEQVTGVPTGFKKFDVMTAGLQKGNFIIIAARPGVGKTSFALNVALHAAVEKKMPVAIFSLEMNEREIMMRLLSSASRIPLQSLRTGFFHKTDWPVITHKAGLLSESPIYLDGSSELPILTLRSSARRLSSRLASQGTPLGLIIVDYLQLMTGSRKNPENRQNDIAEISRSLKALARDLNVPVMALSQLNRSPEEKGKEGKPQLSNLRESGALEQDADLVGLIYREAMYKTDADEEMKRKAKLIIAKQRNGPLGDVDLVFMGECSRFENFEQESD